MKTYDVLYIYGYSRQFNEPNSPMSNKGKVQATPDKHEAPLSQRDRAILYVS